MAISKFILLNTHRSGTRLLLGSLGSMAQVKCYKKAFDLTIILDRFAFDRFSSQFYKFRSASIRRQIDYVFNKKKLINNFLRQIYTPVNSVEVIGIRLLYEQADKYPEILEWAVENNVAIIHLIRENSLKAVVFTETSFKRGLLHSTSRANPVPTIHLSPARLKKQLAKLSHQTEKYRTTFGNNRYLEISYESFIANRAVETGRLLEFLEIGRIIPAIPDPAGIKPEVLENIVENYDEIRHALAGTVFEKFLKETSMLC